MLGSGFGLYALEANKREKNRRSKRTIFDKSLRYYKDEGIRKIFPKATKVQLEAIREKLDKQNRTERKKLIIAFILAIPVSISLIVGILKFWSLLNI